MFVLLNFEGNIESLGVGISQGKNDIFFETLVESNGSSLKSDPSAMHG